MNDTYRLLELFVGHDPAAGDPARSSITLEQAAEVVRRLAPTLDVEMRTPLEDPRQALLELAESASMIVVGTRGHGPVRRLLLGSVSTAVSQYATSPVAVVRPVPPKAKEGVVVGVDGGATSSAVLDTAFELASLDGLPLHVVHSWAEVDLFVDRFSYEQRQEHGDAHERLLAEAVAGYAERYPDSGADHPVVSDQLAALELAPVGVHVVGLHVG